MSAHLDSLRMRLSHERVRLAGAKTQAEKDLRGVWAAQLEREIAAERQFLGLPPEPPLPDLTDDELARELGA